MLREPAEHALPTVERRVLPVLRPVDGEESVPRVLVGVELEYLAVLLQRGFGLRIVLGRGARVLHAEQSEQRTLKILRELDGRRRLSLRQLLRLRHHAAAVAVDRRVDAAQRA